MSVFPILPSIALAQTLSAQGLISKFLAFSNKTLLPFLIGIAFLFFAVNIIRFFVIQGSNEDGRENAKNLAIYSVLAFVLIVIFWGIVNLLSSSIGLNGDNAPTPDYLEMNDKNFTTPPPRTPSSNTASSCTNLQTDFDNEFGGPCATNGKTAPTTPSARQPVGGPQNLLPPQYGGPDGNVSVCPPGSSFNPTTDSCDYQ